MVDTAVREKVNALNVHVVVTSLTKKTRVTSMRKLANYEKVFLSFFLLLTRPTAGSL